MTFSDSPPSETLANWWKRMGSKEVQKKDAKMHKKLMKARAKASEKHDEEMWKAEEEARK